MTPFSSPLLPIDWSFEWLIIRSQASFANIRSESASESDSGHSKRFVHSHSLPPSLALSLFLSFSHLYGPRLSFSQCRMCRTMCRRYSDRCCSPSTSCRYSLFAVCAASRTETPRPALYTNNWSHVISLLAVIIAVICDFLLSYSFFFFVFFFFFQQERWDTSRSGCVYACTCTCKSAMCGKREEWRTFIHLCRPTETLYNKCIALSHCNKSARTKNSFEHLKTTDFRKGSMSDIQRWTSKVFKPRQVFKQYAYSLSSRIFISLPRIRAMCTDLIFQSRVLTFLSNEALQHRGSWNWFPSWLQPSCESEVNREIDDSVCATR